jgi:NOL1/NOP2/fmu family ribosome biogenesis protein
MSRKEVDIAMKKKKAKIDFEILNNPKKKELIRELRDYGIKKLPYLVVKWGKRLRIFSGSLSKESIYSVLREVNVDVIGLYFASLEQGLRLNLDAIHLLSDQITSNIIEVSDEQARQWFKGQDIELNEGQKEKSEKIKSRFIILKNRDDIIGIGKKSFKGITNFMPKERRIK